MTAKFDAFKAALDALCIEHGIHLRGGDDYDDYGCYVEDASEELPAGLHLRLDDVIPMNAEERAAEVERRRVWTEGQAIRDAEWRAEHERAHAEVLASPTYNTWLQQAEAEAQHQREQLMRISTDPKDPAFLDDRPRKVWCNDIEIEGWTVADEFRRCVITPTKVHNGSVRIERLPDDYTPNFTMSPPEPPIDTGFSGMFVNDKPAAQVASTSVVPEGSGTGTVREITTLPIAAAATAPKPKARAKRRR